MDMVLVMDVFALVPRVEVDGCHLDVTVTLYGIRWRETHVQ